MLAKLIVESAKWIRIHYGGPTSLARSHTHFDSGTGQGDPWSTVTFCVAYELRGLLVMQTHQGVVTPWGTCIASYFQTMPSILATGLQESQFVCRH